MPLPTDSSLATVHHDDGGEDLTNILEGCSFEGMVFLDVSCSQCGDGTFDISRNNITDTIPSLCPDRRDDDDGENNIVVTDRMVTLTPSSVSYCEGSHSEPGVSASGGYGNQQEPLVVTSSQEDRSLDDNVVQTNGFAEMDSNQEHATLEEGNGDEGAKIVGPYITIPQRHLWDQVLLQIQARITPVHLITCTASSDGLHMPGDQLPAHPTTPGQRFGRYQADHAVTGREVLSADRIPVTREPRDEVPLSQAELIPPMKCDAGTGPCLTQCIQTEHVQGHGQVDQAVHGYGVSDSNVTPVTIEQLDMRRGLSYAQLRGQWTMVNMRTSILTVPEGFVIEYHAPRP